MIVNYMAIPGVGTVSIGQITLDEIVEVVSRYHKIDPYSLKNQKGREHWLVKARQEAYYLVRKYCGNIEIKEIGREIGGKNYSTVSYSTKVIAQMIEVNKNYRWEVQRIEEMLFRDLITRAKSQHTP